MTLELLDGNQNFPQALLEFSQSLGTLSFPREACCSRCLLGGLLGRKMSEGGACWGSSKASSQYRAVVCPQACVIVSVCECDRLSLHWEAVRKVHLLETHTGKGCTRG